ncbi:hypothetical protein ACE1CD_20915 [Aerosakkonema sp. BLCC-F183]|uniref:hypothetical protein n=1 Tax=Aerosakkonema sp. BLCC-F183 TaxID=3342834 RepID=UPI0035BA7EED
MTLKEDIEQWRSNILKPLEMMEELRYFADSLCECNLEELNSQFSSMLELCEEALTEVGFLSSRLEDIQRRWGNAKTVVQVALAINAVAAPGDSSITRNLITSLKEVKADAVSFDRKAAQKKLSNVWMTTALGDQGELEVLKTLIDPEGEDRISEQELEQIEVKPSLPHRFLKDPQKPDFYVKSRNLVCDAKAWRKTTVDKNSSSLKDTAEKYANLECLLTGGEARFYFPKDTYEQQKNKLTTLRSELESKYPTVKFRMAPMSVNLNDLEQQRSRFYNYLRYLLFWS